jgi:DNA-binding NarL/FixJ family response regulator
VSKITILLANLPQMMREVLRSIIAHQADMEIIGEFPDPVELLLAAKETRADAVIVEMRGAEEPGLCSHLLAECPNVTILVLESEGNTAFIEQLCPWRREIVDPSEANIVHALRQAVRAPCSSEEGEINGRNNTPIEMDP